MLGFSSRASRMTSALAEMAGSAQDETPGPLDSGTLQSFAVARIAVYRRHAGFTQAVYGVAIQLNDYRCDTVVPKQACNRLSDWAVAYHDSAVVGVEGEHPVGCHSVGEQGRAAAYGH